MISRRNARRRAGVAILAAGALLACGATAPASALWSARSESSGSAIADVQYPAPDAVGCVASGSLLGGSITVEWLAVSGATGYRIAILQGGVEQGSVDVGASTLYQISGGLLSGLLGSSTINVRVQPYYASGDSGMWLSDAYVGWNARMGGLLSSGTCVPE